MPATARAIRVEAEDGVVLHCLEWTSISSSRATAPVIALHGGGANAHWWDHLAAQIAIQRPVYALDFRGHGDSDYPEERRLGAFNDDLEALLGWLCREDVFLFGHSMGAAVALDHASRFGATRGIALVDLARGSGRGSRRRARLALSLRRSYRTRSEAVERFRFLPETSRADESLRRHIAEHSVRPESDGRFGYKFDPGWFSLPSRPRPDLAQIRCPTLLIRGGESGLLSAEAALEFSSQLRACRFVEIPEAGHHVLIDQPEALLSALEDFMDERPQNP
ncbi:MAG: alpha/beta hydrolase [Deltaproteobacteria bacterium]|nr:alpha/beta hydrolase [Deltaproteobacteria bacterium]